MGISQRAISASAGSRLLKITSNGQRCQDNERLGTSPEQIEQDVWMISCQISPRFGKYEQIQYVLCTGCVKPISPVLLCKQ